MSLAVSHCSVQLITILFTTSTTLCLLWVCWSAIDLFSWLQYYLLLVLPFVSCESVDQPLLCPVDYDTISAECWSLLINVRHHSHLGVNRPANRAGNPAFGLTSCIFARTSSISGFISKLQKSLKIATILAVRRHFVRKSSEKTSLLASHSY